LKGESESERRATRLNMKDDRLRIYVNDHLALLVGEIELAQRCQSSNAQSALGDFLAQLVVELKEQRQIAGEVLQKLGGRESLLKQSAAWFAEKLGRFKLNDSLLTYSSLSRVVELEALAAAAQERVFLWESLEAVAAVDRRLKKFDFAALRVQSKKHITSLGVRRRRAAATAFIDE
jgi:hypothetical protein